jgi:PIN domain nuclease of toxin-antitoxin system
VIVATAMMRGLPLLTKDAVIQEFMENAVW